MGYQVVDLGAKLEALTLEPVERLCNFKLVTSDISKKSCPGTADTNEKYERLMELTEEALRGRKGFVQVSSQAEADDLLTHQPTASIHVVNATRAASDDELLLGNVHTEAFIRAMKERSASVRGDNEELLYDVLTAKKESSGVDGVNAVYVCGDISAGWSEDTEAAARTGVASLIDCAEDVFAGRYANGFVLARPPSHHAVGNAELARNSSQKDMPLGFCHLNNIASAIAHLHAKRPTLKVCIFDFDVHPGNGNEDTFWDDPSVLTISIHEEGIWPGEDTGRPEFVGGPNALGSVINFPIPEGATDSEYYYVVKDHIFPQIKEFAPEIIFIAAGYDALDGDAYADQELTSDWYGWCIAELMKLSVAPLVLNLEGGYTPENVVLAIGKTIDALDGADAEDFLSFMSIKPLSKVAAAHNKKICYARRVSLEEKRALSANCSDDVQAAPQAQTGPDVRAATQFKADADAKKAVLEAELDGLTGKINKKARTAKLKQIQEIEQSPEYVDACRVISGQPAKFGNFAGSQVKTGPDVRAATQFKADADAKKAVLEAELDGLTGKINKKDRMAKLKQIQEIEQSPEYVDSCRVISGQPAKFGNFQ